MSHAEAVEVICGLVQAELRKRQIQEDEHD
jgi:hypothetical protein